MMQSKLVMRGSPLMETLSKDHLVRKWWEGRLSPLSEGAWPRKPTAQNLLNLKESGQRDAAHREWLVDSVSKQYQKAGQQVPIKVASLESADARTITTGHQLCLATGPAFTYYKVLSAVVLAEQLEARWNTPVVPVFWLASEDHDFEEIQSLWDGQGWQSWTPPSTGGAVGRMGTEGLSDMLSSWSDSVGLGSEKKANLVDACQGSLADAMRRWMHGAFGAERIVVVDGDDARLKAAFVGPMSQELSGRVVARAVKRANAALEAEGHSPQVHVRPVNLFHLGDGTRERIQQAQEGWTAGDITWPDLESVLMSLKQAPEEFSPNALLRPVYQSFILPDVAVVGGLAEVAYWLQLSHLFPALGMVQPALVPRDGARVLSKKLTGLAHELGLDAAHFGDRLEVWEARHVADLEPPDTRQWRAALKRESDEAGRSFQHLDASLIGSVESAEAKMTKLLDKLDEQARRAVRRQSKVKLDRLARLHAGLFPDGKAQERVVNWHVLAAQWSAGAISEGPLGVTLEGRLEAQLQQDHSGEDWTPILHTLVVDSH